MKGLGKVLGWRLGTLLDYRVCHDLYGASFIMHPDVLSFFHARFDCLPVIYTKRGHDSRLLGAFCTWRGSHFAGDAIVSKALGIDRYPVNKDEIILPFHKNLKVVTPIKTKSISSFNRSNLLNSTFKLNSNRAICIAKGCGSEGLSSKTKSRRNRELTKFFEAGGEVVEQSVFTPDELTAIYFDLFEARRGQRPGNYKETVEILTSLRQFFFGHVLFLAGKPCAFQLITRADSLGWINFDYVNGGYDMARRSFCPGTVLTWINVKSAYDLCEATGKIMRYSFGKPTEKYKERWCRNEPLGRILSL